MINKVEVVGEKRPLGVGMIFKHVGGDFYILHRAEECGFSLVCINDGWSWSNPVDDINDVFDDQLSSFVAFKGKLTITANLGE